LPAVDVEAMEIKQGTLLPVKHPTYGWAYPPVYCGVLDRDGEVEV